MTESMDIPFMLGELTAEIHKTQKDVEKLEGVVMQILSIVQDIIDRERRNNVTTTSIQSDSQGDRVEDDNLQD